MMMILAELAPSGSDFGVWLARAVQTAHNQWRAGALSCLTWTASRVAAFCNLLSAFCSSDPATRRWGTTDCGVDDQVSCLCALCQVAVCPIAFCPRSSSAAVACPPRRLAPVLTTLLRWLRGRL